MTVAQHPEVALLARLIGPSAAGTVAHSPGGWRDLTEGELEALDLSPKVRDAVLALQELVAHCRPAFDEAELVTPEAVARVYQAKLGALRQEVLLAVALDGRNRIIGEFELASGGRHSTALTPSDVFRPLIRAGASSFVLVHNHPSGDPKPSADDVTMTCAVRLFGHGLGIVLHDHVIVTSDGHRSLLEQGFLEETEDEQRNVEQALPG